MRVVSCYRGVETVRIGWCGGRGGSAVTGAKTREWGSWGFRGNGELDNSRMVTKLKGVPLVHV